LRLRKPRRRGRRRLSDLQAKAKELTDLQELLAQRDAKLKEAQEAQAELLRKQRELDDAKRELELTVEKRVQASLSGIRQKARMEAEESLKLKVAEKEQQISSMQRQIDELKRKAVQGSQQLQGEVFELELEATLRAHFPIDQIEPVGKGEFGGDVLQGVVSPVGQVCGALLPPPPPSRLEIHFSFFDQRFALRRFLDFLGEALREATVF
jgi:hypothetical protein